MAVNEKELAKVLLQIMRLRRWVLQNEIDPWAARQGLIICLELDRKAALDIGVPKDNLIQFDVLAQSYAQSYIKRIGNKT